MDKEQAKKEWEAFLRDPESPGGVQRATNAFSACTAAGVAAVEAQNRLADALARAVGKMRKP